MRYEQIGTRRLAWDAPRRAKQVGGRQLGRRCRQGKRDEARRRGASARTGGELASSSFDDECNDERSGEAERHRLRTLQKVTSSALCANGGARPQSAHEAIREHPREAAWPSGLEQAGTSIRHRQQAGRLAVSSRASASLRTWFPRVSSLITSAAAAAAAHAQARKGPLQLVGPVSVGLPVSPPCAIFKNASVSFHHASRPPSSPCPFLSSVDVSPPVTNRG